MVYAVGTYTLKIVRPSQESESAPINSYNISHSDRWDVACQVVKAVGESMGESLPDVPGAPCMGMSALTGSGTEALMPTVLQAFETWNMRVPTARLNRWLIKAMLP